MNLNGIKFVFFGSDNVAQSALSALEKHGLRPSERGDVAILVSYGKILKSETLKSFKHGILNIHPSLLPQLRGPSPIKTAILDNLERTGVSIMRLDDKVDHGPILAQEKIALSPRIATENELREALFEKGAELLARVLPDYLEGKITPREQEHSRATYTRKFKSDDAFIPYETWGSDPQIAERKVRALGQEPGAFSIIPTARGKKRIKILKSHLSLSGPTAKFAPDIVQPEGKRPMDWQSFLRGNPLA